MLQLLQFVEKPLQVRHYAQVPCEPFCVDVCSEIEAKRVMDIFASQHLFLYEQGVIPNFNFMYVAMYDEELDEWVEYWNEFLSMDWKEFEETYLIE